MLAKAWGQVKQLVECRFRELSSTQKLEIFFIRFDEGERKVLPLHLSDVLKLVGWSEVTNSNITAIRSTKQLRIAIYPPMTRWSSRKPYGWMIFRLPY